MGNGIAAALRHDYTTNQVSRPALEPRIELERLVPEVGL
jgi:hypothetical protein